MEIAIQTKGINKKYCNQNGRAALTDLDLSVKKGSLFGIIGSDGAGKTTLLRILSTVLQASSGSAFLAGLDVRKQPEDIRKILGYMPQEFSQYPI